MQGLVVRNTGSSFLVKSDDSLVYECRVKGNFRIKGIKSTSPVAVGDRVSFVMMEDGIGWITEIEERKNYKSGSRCKTKAADSCNVRRLTSEDDFCQVFLYLFVKLQLFLH